MNTALRQTLRSRIFALRCGGGLSARQAWRARLPAVSTSFSSVRTYTDQPPTQFNTRSSPSSSNAGVDPSTPVYEEVLIATELQPRSKIAPWLTAMLIGGMALAAYGLGEMWGAAAIWPKDVRTDLRYGLREDFKGDLSLSAHHLSRAWDTAKSLPITAFGRNAYLKTTGIAIALAGVFEKDNKPEMAYNIYKEALNHLQEGSDPTSRLRGDLAPQERMRAVAIAYKLGDLAEKLHKPQEEEEKWLVFSVETILRDIMGSPVTTEVVVQNQDNSSEFLGVIEELKLPNWALKHDLAAPFEALGTFYSKNGKISYAMPLYLQAISILIPQSPQVSSSDDQCRAAQLMGNVSELISRTGTDSESLTQAESWANKGLEVASRARSSTLTKHSVCEVAYAFLLYNLAMIRDMAGDQVKARELFTQSLDLSKTIGLTDGIKNAENAIHELGAGSASAATLLANATP